MKKVKKMSLGLVMTVFFLLIGILFSGLFLGCALSPKPYKIEQSTIDYPGVGPVKLQEMFLFEHFIPNRYSSYAANYYLNKITTPGSEIMYGYSMSVSGDQANIRASRKALSDRAASGIRLDRIYIVPSGEITIIADGQTYSLECSFLTTYTYIVYHKSASLDPEARDAILGCSQLSIDGKEINADGIIIIKKYLE